MGKDEIKKNKGSSFFKTLSSVVIFILILVAIYFIFIRWHFFTPNDSDTFTYSKSDLGTLGDLIGGILNPVLSFVTIGLLLWSIRIQGRELNAATEQSRRSADALIQTRQIHEDSIQEQKDAQQLALMFQLESIASNTLNGKLELVLAHRVESGIPYEITVNRVIKGGYPQSMEGEIANKESSIIKNLTRLQNDIANACISGLYACHKIKILDKETGLQTSIILSKKYESTWESLKLKINETNLDADNAISLFIQKIKNSNNKS